MTALPREEGWPESLHGVVPPEKVRFAVRSRRLVSRPLAKANVGVGCVALVLTLLALALAARGVPLSVMGFATASDDPRVLGAIALLGLGFSAACLGFGLVGPRLPGRFLVGSDEGLVESRRNGYVVWPWRDIDTVEVAPDGTVTFTTRPRPMGGSVPRGKRPPATTRRSIEIVEAPEAEAIAAWCRAHLESQPRSAS